MIPRFTSELHQKHGNFAGYNFGVYPENSRVLVYFDFGRHLNPRTENFISLKPNEYYREKFDLKNLRRSNYGDIDNVYPDLFVDAKGGFFVRVRFAHIKGTDISYPRNIRTRLYGAVESNHVYVEF